MEVGTEVGMELATEATDRSRRLDALSDWAPVLVVGAVSMTGLALEEPWTGTDLELAGTSLATALPLAIRRSRPVLVAGILALVLVCQDVLLGEALHFGSFLGAMVAVYTAARHRSGRPAVAGLVLVLAGMGIAQADTVPDDPAQLVYPVVYFGGVWLLGRGARRLSDQSSRLRSLNQALERDRESREALAVARDRLRLARDLHDTLGHQLVLMVVQAQAAEQTLDADPLATRASLEAVRTAGREGMQKLRQLVDALHEDAEEDAVDAGEDDLARLVERTRAAGLDVRLDVAPVPAELATLVHRVVQESLTNVLKHSRAGRAEVVVRVDDGGPGGLDVVVTDPGPRRTSGPVALATGRGLSGMKGRLEPYGGSLDAGPHGAGYRVRAHVPCVATRPGATG